MVNFVIFRATEKLFRAKMVRISPLFQRKKREEAEREASAVAAKASPSKEEVLKTTKDGDKNSANENIAANDARLVLHVTDKTLGEDIHSRRNTSKFSFHDNSDTESEFLLNVDGNESLQNLEEPVSESSKELDQAQNKLAKSQDSKSPLGQNKLAESPTFQDAKSPTGQTSNEDPAVCLGRWAGCGLFAHSTRCPQARNRKEHPYYGS